MREWANSAKKVGSFGGVKRSPTRKWLIDASAQLLVRKGITVVRLPFIVKPHCKLHENIFVVPFFLGSARLSRRVKSCDQLEIQDSVENRSAKI
jgi:hypothetical protein